MGKNFDKILPMYSLLPIETARDLWIARAREESGRVAKVAASLALAGLVPVDGWGGEAISPDGREVAMVLDGIAYALTPEARAQRNAETFAAKKRRNDAKPGESLTSVLCPACQSVMAKSPVCPGCAKGRAGFKILCICTECAHEVYL